MRPESRAFHVSILAITAACLGVHAVCARAQLSWMWGAHFYAFFPRYWMYAATIFVALCVATLDPRGTFAARFADAASRVLTRRSVGILAASSVVAGAVAFWVFRICHTYLGDGNVIVAEIDTKRAVLPREPLTSLLQYFVYGITKPWFADTGRAVQDVAKDAVAVGSVAAGAVSLCVLWFLADEISRLRAPAAGENRRLVTVLLWLCLAGQGYMQLFFGYVENYSFYAVGVVLFLWLSLRCLRGACGVLLPALALCLCFALHLASAVLAAPFLAVVIAVLARPSRRRGTIRDLLVVAGVLLVSASILARRGHNPFSTLLDMAGTAFSDPRNRGYTFSARHYRDFLNEQMLIGPLGLFLFLAALVTMTRPTTEQRGAAAFLASAGALFAVSSWMFGDSNLGYARDWDLLSHAGIVFTAAGFGLFLLRRTPFRLLAACLCIAWLVSLYHTVPWVLTNASETRSLARMQTLPLGYGRTEVLVAGWYERRGDIDRARAWLERSIAAFPANPNSHAILGSIEMKQHHYDRALVDFENAVRSRPDKISYRVSAVQASFLSGQPARAVPHLHAVLRQMPGNTYPVLVLAEAYHQSGRTEEATRFYTQARAACTDILTAQPSNALVLAIYGWSLFRLGEVDESVHVLSRAIKADPRLQVARCYYGSVLRSLGRSDEARAELLQCRDLGTDLPAEIPDRAGIIAWLESP